MKNTNRIESIDWLRGLMALSIMLYHYTGAFVLSLDSGSTLGRLGIYGVSIFFILSGLSMAIVYNKYIRDIKTAVCFFIRRIFRIWPLLWMVAFMLVLISILFQNEPYSISMVILNITTLFGFINPSAYMATGAWSIGNEMVYYIFTPLIIVLYNRKKLYGNLFFLFTLIIGIYFSQFVLSPTNSLNNQWHYYINPFNNLYLYVSGIAIFYNLKSINLNVHIINILLFSSCIVFVFAPFEGDQINITTGIGRAVFSILSISIVIAFYKLNIKLPQYIGYQFEQLGCATYSVYLLHPIVSSVNIVLFSRLLHLSNPIFLFVLSTIFTITISLISYKYFETPFINLGKRLTSSRRAN